MWGVVDRTGDRLLIINDIPAAGVHDTYNMSVNEDGSPEETQNITQHEFSQEREHAFPALPRLDRVPLEILAEILSYLNSPQDVLSVARCNKHLRATLLNPSNEVIWRRARRHCIVPGIPDPLPGWSEPVYAAFIFDAGNCFVRHGTTPKHRR
jgi:hypothetical protein